jgi:hypothetical protein
MIVEWINSSNFPRPSASTGETIVLKGSFITLLLAAVAILLALLSVYFGAKAGWRFTWWLWGIAAIAVACISLPTHELLHLISHPKFGATEKSKIGANCVKGVPALWVGYAGWVSRFHALFTLMLPFTVLAVFGFIFGLICGYKAGSFLIAVSAVNVLASRSDLCTSLSLWQSRAKEIFESESGYYTR